MKKNIIFFLFLASFFIAAYFVMDRLVGYPVGTPDTITINFYLVSFFLVLAFIFGGLYVFYEKISDKRRAIQLAREALFYALLISGSGLAWSLRGIWGHQTGTIVFGGIVSLIIAPRLTKIDKTYFIFFQLLAFSIGAMIPFATYPIIPRIFGFGIWGALGGIFAGMTLGFDEKGRRYRFSSEQVILYRKAIVKLTFFGFIALSSGIVIWSGLTSMAGWFSPELGGFFCGGIFGLVYYPAIKTCHKNLFERNSVVPIPSGRAGNKHDENDGHQDLDKATPKKRRGRSLFRNFLWIFNYAIFPVITVVSTIDYLYFERGYTEIPIMLIFSVILIWEIAVVILGLSKKIGPDRDVKKQLVVLFLTLIWISSLSAILRNVAIFSGLSQFWALVAGLPFERDVLFITITLTILYPIYMREDQFER
ncbi:MAG: hypothetical protein ACTSUE_05490 [Promethearchaeota archaeon]